MWIGHVAAGLVAKVFAPGVPLWLLILAGFLPDAIFFTLSLFRVESFQVHEELARRGGCFPYAADYPYSHSLVGIAVIGIALTAAYILLSDRNVKAKEAAALFSVVLSHFFLELPSHRPDIKLHPAEQSAHGAGLLDYSVADFIIEGALFLWALWVYATYAPLATKVGFKGAGQRSRLWLVVSFLLFQQAQFCFGRTPTDEVRWVHAPLYLSQILVNCMLIGRLEF
ncbi:hypothetical protein EDD16DRAFT_1484723 [Pisolithus croceorrhizus]|nr:hypothetical protein EDD16DRAFT_1484723 [Pisolithus croceorrhizus]KAI6114938.1 hypothetical protein EV401DRAFT_1865718 [Pisolithus croceorrhizus]KAI6163807.1 hypothetical protein EDD17DRAFT_437394 [Pisolithus thermaeus]